VFYLFHYTYHYSKNDGLIVIEKRRRINIFEGAGSIYIVLDEDRINQNARIEERLLFQFYWVF
jgi:hypothetical protein